MATTCPCTWPASVNNRRASRDRHEHEQTPTHFAKVTWVVQGCPVMQAPNATGSRAAPTAGDAWWSVIRAPGSMEWLGALRTATSRAAATRTCRRRIALPLGFRHAMSYRMAALSVGGEGVATGPRFQITWHRVFPSQVVPLLAAVGADLDIGCDQSANPASRSQGT